MTRFLSLALAAVMFLGVATITGASYAQERPARASLSTQETAPARATTRQATPARATTSQAPRGRATIEPERAAERLSPEFQRALESGNMRLVASYLPSRHNSGRTPLTVGIDPQAHACSGGNCACAGVEDCVGMVDDKICKPDTIGCNANGCACEEADPTPND